MPRSGSTWVAKILDTNPRVIYRHEPDSARRVPVPLAAEPPFSGHELAMVHDYVAGLRENQSAAVSGKLPLFDKVYHSGPTKHLFATWSYAAKAVSRTGYTPVLPDLVSRSRRESLPILWKSIESLGRLGLLMAACPQLRTVHLARHPCGQISSVLRGERLHKFSSTAPASEDYGIFEQFAHTRIYQQYRLSTEHLRKLLPEQRLAWRWVLFNDKAYQDCKALPGYSFIRYEDICKDPQAAARGMLQHLQLEWSQQTDSFIASHSRGGSDEFYSIKRDPLMAANKWRTELTAAQIEAILEVAKLSDCGRLFLDD